MSHLQLPRWQAVYELPAADYEEAKRIAHGIAVEQTIEFPYDLVTGTWFADEMTGMIESLEPFTETTWRACISYPTEAVQGDFIQFLNMLYGNSSLQPGIRALDLKLPPELFAEYPGPKYGLAGLRERWQRPKGPLTMAVLKPIGHTSREFAAMAYAFAKGGIHTIKDDHSLYNQAWSPFDERVRYCVDAVAAANAETGGHTAYFANVCAEGTEVIERAFRAQEYGAGGIMLSPALVGWGIIRELSRDPKFTLPILLHPSFSGPFIRTRETGLHTRIFNGYLPRLAGADGVIIVGCGGRFSLGQKNCIAARNAARKPWGGLAPVLPSVGGGMNRDSIPAMARLFGEDVLYLVGGDLFRRSNDLTANAQALLTLLDEIYAAR